MQVDSYYFGAHQHKPQAYNCFCIFCIEIPRQISTYVPAHPDLTHVSLVLSISGPVGGIMELDGPSVEKSVRNGVDLAASGVAVAREL